MEAPVAAPLASVEALLAWQPGPADDECRCCTPLPQAQARRYATWAYCMAVASSGAARTCGGRPSAVCRLQDVQPVLRAPKRRHQARPAANGAGRAVAAAPPAPAGVPRHGRRVRRGRAGAGLHGLRRLPPAALACRGRVRLLLTPPGHAAAAGLGGCGPLSRRAGAVRGPLLPGGGTARGCQRWQAQPARAWRCSCRAVVLSALRGGAAEARRARELAEACWCRASHSPCTSKYSTQACCWQAARQVGVAWVSTWCVRKGISFLPADYPLFP